MLASYSVNSLNQAAWLVYINGIEVPVIGWTVNYGLWSFATATLNMVPHPTLQRIGAEDRLQVAIFYLDLFWDVNQPTFRLLGEFEVIGMSYIGSGFSRQISLNCISPLQIFNQLKFFYMASVDDTLRGALPSTKSDPTVSQIPKPMYPASLFLEGLTQPQTTGIDSFIKRPVDLVLNIFRSLLSDTENVQSSTTTSVTIPAKATSIPGKNFFARWMKMNNFHMRWAALPEFEDDFTEAGCFPIIKAAQDVNTLTTVRDKFSESVGPAGSAWDLLQQVLGYMYMEIITIPAPSASTITPKTFVLPSLNAESIPAGNVRTIPTYCVKPQSFFGLAPTCNVIFPSMLDSIQSSESYLTQPTRLYLNESFMSQVVKGPETAGSTNGMIDDLLSTAYPPAVRARMKELAAGTTGANNKNLLLYPEEFFKGPVTKRMSAPPWLVLLQASLKKKQIQPGGEAPKAEALGNIFDLYAQYEYFRARYADRNGVLNMDFNPYPIPGFPCVVFDDRNVCFDTMGYVVNVSHTASATGTFKTSISTSFNRTISECLGYEYQSELLESEDAKNNPGDPIVVPPVPTPSQLESVSNETKSPIKGDGTMTFVIGSRGVTKIDKKGNRTVVITRPEERVSFKAFDSTGKPTAEAKTKYNEIMKPTDGGEMDLRLLQVFQLVAEKWPGKAIVINRSTVEGSDSQHGRNNAVDFHVQGVPTPQVFRYINAQFKSTKDTKLGLELAATDGSGAAGFIHADIRSKTWRSVDISGSGEKSSYLSKAEVKNIAAGQLLPYEKVDPNGFTGAGSGSSGVSGEGTSNIAVQPYREPDFVAVDIFPPEPIPVIRKTLQVMDKARSFYGRLLYRGVAKGRPPAYDWRDMMDLKIGDAEPIAVDEDYSLSELFSKTDGSDAITFVPKKSFSPLFTSNTKAMNYVARPACTLQEYIEIKNGAPLETLLKDKSKLAPVAGLSLSFYGGSKGSRFWGKIFNLTQGNGSAAENPGVNFTNVGPPPDYSAAATMEFLGTTAAQTGKNWAKILLRYRQIVRGESGFNTGQV